MALTRDFKQTIIERINRDPDFAKALQSKHERYCSDLRRLEEEPECQNSNKR